MPRLLLLFVTILTAAGLSAQIAVSDSVGYHSPKKATWLSVAMPGAGQIYNKKYWKLPIIYGGIGLTAYYLDQNLDGIDRYRQALKNLQDDDPTTGNDTRIPDSELSEWLDRFKRYRDLSYISFAGIYLLQIVDANVDAHLWHFDVGDDLTLTAMPYSGGIAAPSTGLYLSLTF